MQRRFKAASLVIAAGLSLSLVGCGEVNKLKARKAYKLAIELYKQQDYKAAADKYKEAVDLDPGLTQAYFYLANSYDNQFKATKRGDPTNDDFLTKAIQYYQVAADKDPAPAQRKLAMQFLVSDYGTDKMNDPARQEPIIQKMIEVDPSDVTNYFGLAKVYDDAGAYDQEEQVLLRAKEIKPKDPAVYGQLAGFYNKQGEFEKTIDAYRQWQLIEPNNPEVHYTMGAFYWDKGTKDRRLKTPEKKQMAEEGLKEVDKALQLKPDYIEALVMRGLLMRLQAGLEPDRAKYDQLMKDAQGYTDRATALQKKRAAGLMK
jgi:tetratricopeptide (TPR) repeat protein